MQVSFTSLLQVKTPISLIKIDTEKVIPEVGKSYMPQYSNMLTIWAKTSDAISEKYTHINPDVQRFEETSAANFHVKTKTGVDYILSLLKSNKDSAFEISRAGEVKPIADNAIMLDIFK